MTFSRDSLENGCTLQLDTFMSSLNPQECFEFLSAHPFSYLCYATLLSQSSVVSKENLLQYVKHMSSATMTDVNLTSMLPRSSKSVSVSNGTNDTNNSSLYASPLTKELQWLGNNREIGLQTQLRTDLFYVSFVDCQLFLNET